MEERGILVHYAELGIKGKNRDAFIKRLRNNIERSLKGCGLGGVQKHFGRLWLYPQKGADLGEEALAQLAEVVGIAYFAQAVRCELTLEAIQRTALAMVLNRRYETFRVTARRAFKDLPFPSNEVARDVGAYLLDHKPAKVKMKDAELNVHIEMLPNEAFVWVDKLEGKRGLPSGTGGKLVGLLSGGIDSPVAIYRMQKRGCHCSLVHFHSQPFLSRASEEKARQLAAHLAKYQGRARLYLVPFGELQREIVTSCPMGLRVVLYRRFMMRIAALIAERERAQALVTGESLGQVASQTLTNMAVIEEAAPLPILRPLVGFDKQEIINEAEALGTYAISVIPDQDCCQLFVPKHPETHARLEAVKAAEAGLDIAQLVHDAVERAELVEVFPETSTNESEAQAPQA